MTILISIVAIWLSVVAVVIGWCRVGARGDLDQQIAEQIAQGDRPHFPTINPPQGD